MPQIFITFFINHVLIEHCIFKSGLDPFQKHIVLLVPLEVRMHGSVSHKAGAFVRHFIRNAVSILLCLIAWRLILGKWLEIIFESFWVAIE